MVNQNLTRVTNLSDIYFISSKLVTPSHNYTPSAVLKSRNSKLVMLICTLVRINDYILLFALNSSSILENIKKSKQFGQIFDFELKKNNT